MLRRAGTNPCNVIFDVNATHKHVFASNRGTYYDLVAFGDLSSTMTSMLGKEKSHHWSYPERVHKNQVINPKAAHSSIRMFKTVASPRSISDITLSETVPTLRTNLWCETDRI